MQLKNSNVYVEFRKDDKPFIRIQDLNDCYNLTTGFTQNVRGIKKAWQFLEQIFNDERLKDDLNFNDVKNILDDKFNLKMHIYCAMD